VGEPVWAIGHPFGSASSALLAGLLQWSVSAGVVSGIGERMIQIDAPVNPGNSGGPIIDAEGRVVGVVSRKLRGDNVAFAAPSDAVAEMLDAPDRMGVFGGQIAVGPWLALPPPGGAASAGLGAELWLRDRVLLGVGAAAPLGARWGALQWGEARWASASGFGALRLRLGQGTFSTTLDVGGGALVLSGYQGFVDEGRVGVLSLAPALAPMAMARAGLGGVGVRWMVAWRDGQPTLWAGMDLSMPGVLAVF
jgi:hypothetical protein